MSLTTPPSCEVAFVYFNTLSLDHLDAAWYALSKQRFEGVTAVRFLDNNTPDDKNAIAKVLLRYKMPVPVHIESCKHGDPTRTQSWSVNTSVRSVTTPLVFFTRADYILDFDCLQAFRWEWMQHHPDWRGFVTSYAYHMAYDARGDQRTIGFRDIEQHDWRTLGAYILRHAVNGWDVTSSDTDAGVWLMRRADWEAVGGENEGLVAWGLQQTVFQQALHDAGVEIAQIPAYLFFHQHHGGTFRDYDRALAELEAHWGPRDRLRTFRDLTPFTGKVCDELDPP